MEYTIEFTAKEKTALKGENEGKKFFVYTAYGKGQKKIDLRFTRNCENPNPPKKEGTFIAVVKSENMNRDNTRRFPVLWVKKIESVCEKTFKEEDFSDIFDEKN